MQSKILPPSFFLNGSRRSRNLNSLNEWCHATCELDGIQLMTCSHLHATTRKQSTTSQECKIWNYKTIRSTTRSGELLSSFTTFSRWVTALSLMHVFTYLSWQIFKDATLFFSCDGTPSIASVIPAMDHIDQHLATAASGNKYNPAIKATLTMGKRTTNRYYDWTDHSEVYRIAMSIYLFSHSFIPLLTSHSQFYTCVISLIISRGPDGMPRGLIQPRKSFAMNLTESIVFEILLLRLWYPRYWINSLIE